MGTFLRIKLPHSRKDGDEHCKFVLQLVVNTGVILQMHFICSLQAQETMQDFFWSILLLCVVLEYIPLEFYVLFL